MDLGLGLRRRRHTSPPRRDSTPHRDDIASDDHGPPSPAPPSARSHLKSLVARIRRYSERAPPTGPSFETALSAVGHLSLHRADHPVHAPAAPTASALDSTVMDSIAPPTSPAPSDHPVRALPRLQTSDHDIDGPAAPFASALYVGLAISPAPSALTSDPLLRMGTTGIDDAAYSSADALNEISVGERSKWKKDGRNGCYVGSTTSNFKARFTRDNVLYAFSFLCLGAIRGTMKDLEDVWYAGFKDFFILMMVVCFGMIGVGIMANTSTRMSETDDMISAVMSRTSFILSSCLLLITVSFFAGGHGFISGIIAALAITIVMVSAWKSRDPTTSTVVSTFFSSCLSKIKVGWRSRSQSILPL